MHANELIDDKIADAIVAIGGDDESKKIKRVYIRSIHLPLRTRRMLQVLRLGYVQRQAGIPRRGGGYHSGAVHRRARYAADHENLPYRRCGIGIGYYTGGLPALRRYSRRASPSPRRWLFCPTLTVLPRLREKGKQIKQYQITVTGKDGDWNTNTTPPTM